MNSTKNLPAGEGGLFVTTSETFHARAARVRFDGLAPPSKWDPERPLDDEADSLSEVRGWMYLPGELTCAIARAQLMRLAETTRRAQRNGAALTARLAGLPGVIPPAVPSDRTHVYHKYRVRLDPQAAGLRLSPRSLRERVLDGLRAEGVEAVLWQEVPLPAHPLFHAQSRYPVSAAALDASLIIGSQSYPLFAQPLDVVEAWAEAFERVWRSLRS
jgi:perosamine synthetase